MDWTSKDGYSWEEWRRQMQGMIDSLKNQKAYDEATPEDVEFALKPFDTKETGGEGVAAMSQVEEFLITALKEMFGIDHFMTDQGNHIFIDNDPGYYKEKHIWRLTPEELKAGLQKIQTSLSPSPR